MNIEIKKSAEKDILKINEPFKQQIKNAIAKLKEYPRVSNIKKLKNHKPNFRLRVGDFRILFDIDDEKELLLIARILHRKEAY